MSETAIQTLLRATQDALIAATERDAAAHAFTRRGLTVGTMSAGTIQNLSPHQLPVCRYFATALNGASQHAACRPVVAALEALHPHLAWHRRPATSNSEANFPENHANAQIIGPTGLQQRQDFIFGLSLVAPNVTYPDHTHPPEEIYLVLSPGQWWNADTGWREPGIGGYAHNPPEIIHAMRSGDAPLLAIWCLLP